MAGGFRGYIQQSEHRPGYASFTFSNVRIPVFESTLHPEVSRRDFVVSGGRIYQNYFYTIETGARGAPSKNAVSTAVIWADLKRK